MMTDGSLERVSKKEGLSRERELEKLERSLGGIKDMEKLPDVLFVVDVGYEKIAVSEAVKLGIPVVGIVDTNHTPDGVDYVIPGNDDAIRAIQLYVKGAADAVLEGRLSAQLAVPGADDSATQAPPATEKNVTKEKLAVDTKKANSPDEVPVEASPEKNTVVDGEQSPASADTE